MRLLKATCVWILWLGCSITSGELSLTSRPAKALTGVSNPEVIANVVLVGNDSVPVVSQVAIVKASTKAKFIRVRARNDLFNSTALAEIAKTTDEAGVTHREYLLSGAGRYAVEAMTFDPDSGIEEQTIEVLVGPSKPPQPPDPTPVPVPPTPDVKPDEFDNIAQRVAKWTAGLPKRLELSAIYRMGVSDLRTKPAATIETVLDSIIAGRTALLGPDLPSYSQFISNLSQDQTQRWSSINNKGTFRDYLSAIANGLEGK